MARSSQPSSIVRRTAPASVRHHKRVSGSYVSSRAASETIATVTSVSYVADQGSRSASDLANPTRLGDPCAVPVAELRVPA